LRNYFSTLLPDLCGGEPADGRQAVTLAFRDLDAAKALLGGREGLSVRFKVNVTVREIALLDTTERSAQAFEVVLLPHFQGYLRASMRYPAEDAGYYEPILGRFKHSLTSLEQPVEYQPEPYGRPNR